MLLPDVADLAITEGRKPGFGKPSDIRTFVEYRAVGGFVETTDEVQESTLSSSAFTDDGDLFARRDFEVKVAKNYEIFVPGSVDFREFFDTNQWRWGQLTV